MVESLVQCGQQDIQHKQQKIFNLESWKNGSNSTWSGNGIISIQKLKTLFSNWSENP
jgi:hypothetical protein